MDRTKRDEYVESSYHEISGCSGLPTADLMTRNGHDATGSGPPC